MQFSRKENTDIVQIKKFIIKIKVARGSIKLFNLFNGDKTLGMLHPIWYQNIHLIDTIVTTYITGDALNSVINENFDVLR